MHSRAQRMHLRANFTGLKMIPTTISEHMPNSTSLRSNSPEAVKLENFYKDKKETLNLSE